MPYTPNPACGDGAYEPATMQAVSLAYANAGYQTSYYHWLAVDAENARYDELSLAFDAMQNGDYEAYYEHLDLAAQHFQDSLEYRSLEEDWAESASLAALDIAAEEGDYATEWAAWYAIGINSGASPADAADCAHDYTVS